MSKRALIVVGKNEPHVVFRHVRFLASNGFDDLIIVLNSHFCGHIMQQIGNGSAFKSHFTYLFQEDNGNVVDALYLAKPLLMHEFAFAFLAGDAVFPESLEIMPVFMRLDPVSYGKAVGFYEQRDMKFSSGLYFYTPHVFRLIEDLRQRIERVELRHVNQHYAQAKCLHIECFDVDAVKPALYNKESAVTT